jgi:hypothetical protein
MIFKGNTVQDSHVSNPDPQQEPHDKIPDAKPEPIASERLRFASYSIPPMN